MFNSLKGIITEKNTQRLCIETSGIEWELTCPDSSLEKLPNVGSEGRVFTYLQHTDNLMVLFGFASVSDRNLFLDLLKVDGIGPKGAVKIMSNISSSQLAEILETENIGALEKVPGVGKKTAAKMLLSLKGKLHLENVTSVNVKNNSPYSELIESLVQMGYEKQNVVQKVAEIASRLENDENFKNGTQAKKEEAILRVALVELI